MEYWKVKEEETVFFSIKTQYSNTPLLQRSNWGGVSKIPLNNAER
jgi:hypothetical protein